MSGSVPGALYAACRTVPVGLVLEPAEISRLICCLADETGCTGSCITLTAEGPCSDQHARRETKMPDDSRPAVTIPPADARSFPVTAGETFRVVDVEGQQVADFVALSLADPNEGSSPSQTILFNHPRVRLQVGDFFYSSECRPMFEIVADDAHGVHDFLYAACNSAWYSSLGFPGHRNCQDNLAAALSDVWKQPKSGLPSPINLFQDTYPDASGNFAARPAPTAPGGAITLRALMDCVVAVTSCASDTEAAETCINGPGSSPIRIDFEGPGRPS